MGTAQISQGASGTATVGRPDERLEVMTIPVSDPGRSRDFYRKLGWREDKTPPGRFQFTPPGSSCSVQFGAGLVPVAPGSAQRMFLITPDIVAARDAVKAAGVEVSDIFHLTMDGVAPGPDPERGSYRSLFSFEDPDGNGWQMQEVTSRLPGRVDPGPTRYASPNDLASALRRAAAAHGEHEKRTGKYDENWPDWYAEFMVDEQTGQTPPT